MRVYHFVNSTFGLDDLRRRRLKIATFSDLNDPFELIGPASSDRQLRQAFHRLKEQLTVSRGMLCFSRHWSNPVQWSHYADRHRGVCLGFDVADAVLTAVGYQAKRLEPNIAALVGGGPDAEREMLKVLSTKYSHWRYENEVRCFCTLDEKDQETGLYFMPFSDGLSLREVIVGHCSTIGRGDLKEALGNIESQVTAYKARLSFLSFRVVRQRNKSLWV